MRWTFPTLILEVPIFSFRDIGIKMVILVTNNIQSDYKDVQAYLVSAISGGCGAQKKVSSLLLVHRHFRIVVHRHHVNLVVHCCYTGCTIAVHWKISGGQFQNIQMYNGHHIHSLEHLLFSSTNQIMR